MKYDRTDVASLYGTMDNEAIWMAAQAINENAEILKNVLDRVEALEAREEEADGRLFTEG